MYSVMFNVRVPVTGAEHEQLRSHICLTDWIVFSQHHFFSETVSLCVEEVACPGSAHHLHQDGPDGGEASVIITMTAPQPVHGIWYW